jgi:hypothetical protein
MGTFSNVHIMNASVQFVNACGPDPAGMRAGRWSVQNMNVMPGSGARRARARKRNN